MNDFSFLLHSTSDKATQMMPCRLVVMRHGERIDDLFPKWIRKSTSSGSYQAFDLNMVINYVNYSS